MPSIEKRGSNYRVMVSLGYDMDGKQIRKTTTYTPPEGVTEGKAKKLATAFAYEFEKHCMGMTNMNENIRFSELCDWYFSQIAVHKLKPTTYENNLLLMRIYVLPYIGNMKLKDINTARIDALFNQLFRDGRIRETYRLKDLETLGYGIRRPLSRKSGVNMNTLRTLGEGGTVMKSTAERIAEAMGVRLKDIFTAEQIGGGLDEGTLKRVRSALSPIFSTAVKKELLLKNPVFNATTPSSGIEKERVYLNAEQCKQLMTFMDEFSNPEMPRIIKVLIYTGMRVGELAGLLWENVDLDRAMLTVKYNSYQ